MRLFLALSLLASTLSAGITFEPPNPTSATPVVARVAAFGCPPTAASVQRNGRIISITLDIPQCLVATAWEMPVSLGAVPPGVYDVVASPRVILLLIAEGFLVVRDAEPPFEVVPNVVPSNGGEIHLRANGQNLYNCVAGTPVVCEGFTVKIGGQTANVVSSTQSEIVVIAPVHGAGAVDVTIDRNAGGPLTATAALDYFEFDKTPDAAFFEPVLLPALVSGPGAFGSRWTTDASLHNANDLPLPVTSNLFTVACFPVCDTRPAAHGSVTIRDANAPGGLIFYAARQFAPRLFFDILARDLSRQSEALGTEIPVAREHDLFDRPFSILLVPVEAKYRTALRLFRIDGGASVHVRIVSMNGEVLLADEDVPLTNGSAAIADLAARYPQVAGKGPLRIEVDGKTGQRATWALVSVTNNDTQHVTVIAPH